jgi:hypothetical protein
VHEPGPRHAGIREVQRLQQLQSSQLPESRVADWRVRQIEFREPLEPVELVQVGVRDLRALEVEPPKLGQDGQVAQCRVGYLRLVEAHGDGRHSGPLRIASDLAAGGLDRRNRSIFCRPGLPCTEHAEQPQGERQVQGQFHAWLRFGRVWPPRRPPLK